MLVHLAIAATPGLSSSVVGHGLSIFDIIYGETANVVVVSQDGSVCIGCYFGRCSS